MVTQPKPSASSPAGAADPARASWGQTVWRLARWPLICYLAVMVLMMIFEETFIFFPMRYPEGDWDPPGLEFEDAWFEAADGTRIHGWYVPHERPAAAVLFCHGNAGNLSHRSDTLERLHGQVGASVLIFDYRGYGRSDGKPDESGVLADARAARAWLARREGIAETAVVLMGRSLGGAVAVDLAAADGARALVLESTFSSMPDVAAYHYPWLPVRRMMRSRFDSAGKIANYHGPLLQSHGDGDRIVPYEFGLRLFEVANEPKRFIPLSGFSHNVPQPPAYYETLREFLEEL